MTGDKYICIVFNVAMVVSVAVLVSAVAADGILDDPDLMGYWTFDEGTGIVAHDISDNGNNGELMNGGLWAGGHVGEAIDFDGIDDYVQVPDHPSLDVDSAGGAITISCWMYPHDVGDGHYRKVVDKRGWEADHTHCNYEMVVNVDGNLAFYNGRIEDLYVSSIAVPENEWSHYAITLDALEGRLRFYQNGILADSIDGAVFGSAIGFPLWIGVGHNTDYCFDGILDEVMLFRRVLNGEEIYQVFLAGFAEVALDPANLLTRCDATDTLWIVADELALDVQSAHFVVAYESDQLSLIDVVKGQDLSPPEEYDLTYTEFEDYVQIDVTSGSASVDGPAALAGLVMSPTMAASSSEVSFDDVELLDSEGHEVFNYAVAAQLEIDCELPELSVLSPASGQSYQTFPTLDLLVTDNVGLESVFWQLDGCSGDWLPLWQDEGETEILEVSWTIPDVDQGTHTIQFKVVDDAGNGNADSCSYYWEFVFEPPTFALTSEQQALSCSAVDTLWLECDELATNIKAAYFGLGYEGTHLTALEIIRGELLEPSSDFVVYSFINNDSIDISIAALAGTLEGPGRVCGIVLSAEAHTPLTSISVDSVLLRDPENQPISPILFDADLTVDCVPPTVEVLSPAPGGVFEETPQVSVSFSDDLGLFNGMYQIDGCEGAWKNLWTYDCGESDTTAEVSLTEITPGYHRVYFRVKDDAGNGNPDSCSYYWDFTYGMPAFTLEPQAPVTNCAGLDTLWIAAAASAGNIKAAFFRIGYDNNYLSPEEVILGPDLPSSNYVFYPYIYEDSIIVNLAALSGVFDGPGAIAGIVYHGLLETPATVVAIDSSSIRDPENDELPHVAGDVSIRVDCTPPGLTVLDPLPDQIYDVLPTLQIAFSDDVSLLCASYQVDVCSGPWQPIWSHDCGQADTTVSWMVPTIPEGEHTLYFKILDDGDSPNPDTCSYQWPFVFYTGCCYLRGDYSHNGVVDISDIVDWVTWAFEQPPGSPPVCAEEVAPGEYFYPEVDVNADGVVDIADVVYWVDWSFSSPPGPAPVPCPYQQQSNEFGE